jgi:hypothetical protein
MSFYNLLCFGFLAILTIIPSIYSSDTQCSYSPNKYDDKRTDKNVIRLFQYNVECMFYDEYSGCPGSSCVWANQSEVLTHMDYVTNIINELNPDIVNFCEIEGCDEINMIIDRTNPSFNPYLIKGIDISTGQNVAMMTLIDPTIDLYRVETKYEYPISGFQCGYIGTSGTTGVSKHYITQFKFTKSDNTNI